MQFGQGHRYSHIQRVNIVASDCMATIGNFEQTAQMHIPQRAFDGRKIFCVRSITVYCYDQYLFSAIVQIQNFIYNYGTNTKSYYFFSYCTNTKCYFQQFYKYKVLFSAIVQIRSLIFSYCTNTKFHFQLLYKHKIILHVYAIVQMN